MSNYELAKTTLYWLTSWYCTNSTRPHIHQPLRTLNITSQGNSYILTAVYNLTGYLMTTPYQGQKDSDSRNPLIFRHYVKIWLPRILHSDNGMECESKLTATWHKKTYFSPHHLQTDEKLESSHTFIIDCICKFSIDGVLEWDWLLPYATAAFSRFPWTVPGIIIFSIFQMWPLFAKHGSIFAAKIKIPRLGWRYDVPR